MARPDLDEDLDALIDRAVDTFFVEAPSLEEAQPSFDQPQASPPAPDPEPSTSGNLPSFDEVVDTLFMESFHGGKGTLAQPTSGDAEVDRAIDLAVDTLFVEEPDTPPPETAQVQIKVEELLAGDDQFADYLGAPPAPSVARPAVVPHPSAVDKAPKKDLSYDEAMAREIERHMHTLFTDVPKPESVSAAQVAPRPDIVPPRDMAARDEDRQALRKLQEAILTLEWEISRRSVTGLANELHRVRQKFQDNVTVDFAALSMRIVLDYVVKRMSRSHPESIRFLLDVTDYLDGSLDTSMEDPLHAFHQILSRYESYKSIVRKAEGLPDEKPPSTRDLTIKDPDAFARMVEAQATTLMKAGRSLARRLKSSRDSENLIRSFRFLVNRSVNRILGDTRVGAPPKPKKTKGRK